MDVKSLLIIVNNQSETTSDYVSDVPSKFGTLIIIKLESNYYTHAEFIKADVASTIRYFNLYTNESGWNGWDTNFVPLTGGIMTGGLRIKKPSYPSLCLESSDQNTEYFLINGQKNGQIIVRDAVGDESSERLFMITTPKYENSLYDCIKLRSTTDSVDKWYYIYGTHNITSGTSPLTSGSSKLDTGCIYIQYE